jgi:hypothetical protein
LSATVAAASEGSITGVVVTRQWVADRLKLGTAAELEELKQRWQTFSEDERRPYEEESARLFPTNSAKAETTKALSKRVADEARQQTNADELKWLRESWMVLKRRDADLKEAIEIASASTTGAGSTPSNSGPERGLRDRLAAVLDKEAAWRKARLHAGASAPGDGPTSAAAADKLVNLADRILTLTPSSAVSDIGSLLVDDASTWASSGQRPHKVTIR